MSTLENDFLRFQISEAGEIESLFNKQTGVEFIAIPRGFWRLILKDGLKDELPIYPAGQNAAVTLVDGCLTVSYSELKLGQRGLKISLRFDFRLSGDEIIAHASVTNNEVLDIIEVAFPIIDGVRALGENSADDALVWPAGLGAYYPDPLTMDFALTPGYRPYDGVDQYHQDLNLLYPGSASMQWFTLSNDRNGLYLASTDPSLQSTCLNVRRDVPGKYLGLSFIKYPFLKQGEHWESAPFVISAYSGDWHVAAKKYKIWAEFTWWRAPEQPEWVRDFKGWLRVILKHQYGEVLYDYSTLPSLFAEAKEVGFDTLFILGWVPGGFSRLWPEFYPDPEMGGEKGLKDAIQKIHQQGGKVLVFTSYYLADRDTDFYKQIGHRISLKNPWGSEYDFAETYSGEGTWRKIGCGKMPLACMCPSTPEWQREMLAVGTRIAELGADGVLYDIGGSAPIFCFDQTHPHAKPSLAFATKAQNYRELRQNLKTMNPDAMMAMEHTVDVFGQYMDLAHSGGGAGPSSIAFPSLYRYTFPEHTVTNRNIALDESNYVTNANFSFLHGLKFDISIFRCRGTLRDIPNYAAYLKQLNQVLATYSSFLLRGTFVDTEGFVIDNDALLAKGYRTRDGLAVVVWNHTSYPQSFHIDVPNGHLDEMVSISVAGIQKGTIQSLKPNEMTVVIFLSDLGE
ncbi:MAG: hypothetical protein JXA33_25770 [Anaerolineae bacterium]|nr:hypothetical protein [Anaerolineae bacterium]